MFCRREVFTTRGELQQLLTFPRGANLAPTSFMVIYATPQFSRALGADATLAQPASTRATSPISGLTACDPLRVMQQLFETLLVYSTERGRSRSLSFLTTS
jgi:hypothetical protein